MRAFILCAALLALSLPAAAHKVGISRGEYRADGSSLHAQITFARPEMLATMPGLDANGDGILSGAEVASGHDLLASTLVQGLEVSSAKGRCRGELEQAELTANDGLSLQMRYRCDDAPAAFHLRLSLLSSLSVGHRHLAAIETAANSGAAVVTRVVYEASPEFEVSAQASTASNAVAGPLLPWASNLLPLSS